MQRRKFKVTSTSSSVDNEVNNSRVRPRSPSSRYEGGRPSSSIGATSTSRYIIQWLSGCIVVVAIMALLQVMCTNHVLNNHQSSSRYGPRPMMLSFSLCHDDDDDKKEENDCGVHDIYIDSLGRHNPHYSKLLLPQLQQLKEYPPHDTSNSHDRKNAKKKRCQPMRDWHSWHHPSCNLLHEVDMRPDQVPQFAFLNKGTWRDAWRIVEYDGTYQAIKTLRYTEDFSEIDAEKNRRDAVIYERMTYSPNVLNIYGHCVNSIVVEYSEGGNIHKRLWPGDETPEGWKPLTKMERLRIASQVADGLADLHHIRGEEDMTSIAHTDIAGDQYLLVNDKYVLNDFNRAVLLAQYKNTTKECKFYPGGPGMKFRSPEEYRQGRVDHRIDIFQMGNVFYELLADRPVWSEAHRSKVIELLERGRRPFIPWDIRNSSDPVHVALMHAKEMCQAQDPLDRSTALEVAQYLRRKVKKLAKKRKKVKKLAKKQG